MKLNCTCDIEGSSGSLCFDVARISPSIWRLRWEPAYSVFLSYCESLTTHPYLPLTHCKQHMTTEAK